MAVQGFRFANACASRDNDAVHELMSCLHGKALATGASSPRVGAPYLAPGRWRRGGGINKSGQGEGEGVGG